MNRLILATATGLLLAAGGLAGSKSSATAKEPSPCAAQSESHQLDFFLGDWVVESPDGAVKGHSTVTSILDGCALEENWHSDGGYAGRTVHAYFSEDGHWHEFYFDNVGKVHAFVGGASNGAMSYEGTSSGPAGTTTRHRVRIAKRPAGGVDQLWEKSSDGKTWVVAFRATYVKPAK